MFFQSRQQLLLPDITTFKSAYSARRCYTGKTYKELALPIRSYILNKIINSFLDKTADISLFLR